MTIKPSKPRGAPPKDPIKRLEWEKKRAAADRGDVLSLSKPRKKESPHTILQRITKRFEILRRMAVGATKGEVRSLIISGAPGIGKTYTINEVLEQTKRDPLSKLRYEIVKGVISPINLYKMLYRMKDTDQIAVLDDADGIFSVEESLNILKAATDTSSVRMINWMSESGALQDEDIPRRFEYQGSMLFLTNLDFQAFLDTGKTKLTPHLEALMSRAFYLDMDVHGKEELILWINHQVREQRILQQHPHNLTDKQAEDVLQFIMTHTDRFRELSIRTATKAATLVKMEPTGWHELAEANMMKSGSL